MSKTKPEPQHNEDEAYMPQPETFSDYLDILRLHFKEPMHCEVHEKNVRVACRVRFLPDNSQDPQDLSTLIRMMNPRHVVMLPTADKLASGPEMKKQLQYARKKAGVHTPQIHRIDLKICTAEGAKSSALELRLNSLKRKIQFNPELWQKMSFLKTRDGVRVARVRAKPVPGEDQAKHLELDSCTSTDDLRLPREGALFLGLAKEPLSLSSLKDYMSGDANEDVDFKPPMQEHVEKPWSSRILVADNNVALGWSHNSTGGTPMLRVEGVPSDKFFRAREALYKTCALI